jgi:large subunit ribosomal protein L22
MSINAAKKTTIAKGTAIKASVQKLNIIAQLIRGMHVHDALTQLKFCKRKVARDVLAVLNSAIANAENNDNLDIDNLYISNISVGKAFSLKRFHARARGRAGSIRKPFSNITIHVSERG